jgi:5'(3')-deoxyribonucleotidase
MTAYYFDMDGVLANFHKAYATNKGTALQRKAMANLEPFEENVNLVRNMIKAGLKVYILTKAANEAGKLGKIDWLAKYIPEITADQFICIFKGKKIDFIREDGILIDDDKKNLTPWAKAGQEIYFVTEKGAKITF